MSRAEGAFHLVILNPNTSREVTAMLDRQARRVARPETHVVTLCPDTGPAAVEQWQDAYRSAVGMLDTIASFPGPVDALILAGFGDVGLEALREAVSAPVVDITEAGAVASLALGSRYGIVTTVTSMVAPIQASLTAKGLLGRCVSIEPVGLGIAASSSDAGVVVPCLADKAKFLVAAGAEAICLGSAVFSQYAEAVRAAVGVPVVDPLAAAISLVETAR